MAREQFAHFFHQRILGYRFLRLRLLFQVIFALAGVAAQLRAGDQVADDDFATRFFIGALNDGAGAVALVGIFQLLADIVLRDCRDKVRRGCWRRAIADTMR